MVFNFKPSKGGFMNKELLESQWLQIREILKEKFNNLTEDDIRQINGRYDQLVAKLQQKYGYSREEAEERIKSWNFDRFATRAPVAREDRARREEVETSPSLARWWPLLLIPLLLLGAYFLNTGTNPEQTRTITREQLATETPADFAISNGLRNALVSRQIMMSDLRNVQITTHNGVVRLDGTVPSRDVRDSIENIAKDFTGVTQVINNLEIR
jgi:uncharacterized protein YjbJ (UPF0337 family)